MKNFYPFALFILLLFSGYSYVENKSTHKHMNIYKERCDTLQGFLDNYLNSLTNISFKQDSKSFQLLTSDSTVSLSNKKISLFYYFPSASCETCVEENIFELIRIANFSRNIIFYVSTTKEKYNYLKLLSRVHETENLKFVVSVSPPTIKKEQYFMIFKNGEISNTFYPMKGMFIYTKKYLKHIIK